MLKIFLAAILACTALTPGLSGAEQKVGALVLVGGVLRYDNSAVWERIVDLAGGAGAQFVVVPSATERPRLYGGYAVRALNRRGALAELLPLAAETQEFGVDYRDAVYDAKLIANIKNADGVFFTGGAPQRIAQILYLPDGTDSPILTAIRKAYADGAVIAGANVGESAVSTGVTALSALRQGLPDHAITRGLGLFNKQWLVDQHLMTRGRFAVALVAMHKLGIQHALGVGLHSAIVVAHDGQAEIIGSGGALAIDLSQALIDSPGSPYRLTGARVSYLGHGDRINLETRQLTAHTDKVEGFEIDANAVDEGFAFDGISFSPDLFAESTLVSLIYSAIDGRAREGIGLALDDSAADCMHGFKFRFYPGADSVAWLDNQSGRQDYTVSNVRVDVIPVPNTYRHILEATDETR